jgi:hypothetical protein
LVKELSKTMRKKKNFWWIILKKHCL